MASSLAHRFTLLSLSPSNFMGYKSAIRIVTMNLRVKCKKCKKGVLEPTFKGEEMRCFLCGYTTTFSLMRTERVIRDFEIIKN